MAQIGSGGVQRRTGTLHLVTSLSSCLTYSFFQGFFFEPRDNILKLCNEFPGFTRKVPAVTPYPGESNDDTGVSVPRSHAKHPTDFIPKESQEDIRRLIKTLLPRLDDGRPFVGGAMCWCTGMFRCTI